MPTPSNVPRENKAAQDREARSSFLQLFLEATRQEPLSRDLPSPADEDPTIRP